MEVIKIPFDRIRELSARDVEYQLHPEKFRDFISYLPDENGILAAAMGRRKHPVDRKLLKEVLTDQYAGTAVSETQKNNIERLSSQDTFTIITAHQPCLFGGPAYYFYKIFSAINLAAGMSQKYPDMHLVPVLVTGSEDHDFEEMKSAYLFGKTVEWNTSQTGPVGRYTTDGLSQSVDELCQILGNNEVATEICTTFNEALRGAGSYNQFVFSWVNAIFGKYGLLVVNLDEPRLKKAFAGHMLTEILEQKSYPHVKKKQEELTAAGYKPQAYVREINLFYMTDGIRERIVSENGHFHVHNTDVSFTTHELIEEMNRHPERFSPNVVMRPLYQEFTLPNLVYIGGGGEIAYWMERKDQFEAFGIFFPILMRRNSLALIPKSAGKAMAKIGISAADLTLKDESLITSYLERTADSDFHLNDEVQELAILFDKVASKAKAVDPTLEQLVLSEGHKTAKALENIEHRLRKVLKQKEDTAIQQIKGIKQKIFPTNGLQERKDNYLQFVVIEGRELTDKLIEISDPLQKDFLFVHL